MAPASSVKSFHEIPALFGQPIPKKRARRQISDLDQFLRLSLAEPWRDVIRRDPCPYCGNPGGTLDHIEARAAGGLDNVANLTGSCRRCNNRKGTRSLLHHLAGWFRFAELPAPRREHLVYAAAYVRGRVIERRFKPTREKLA